jgi:peptidoglycan hydrolase-like protein with peptidoglycan-binding domain
MAQLIKPGSQGELVTGLQTQLKGLGFEVNVDGIFGPSTRSAVEDLQALFGYDVDGIAGDATQKLITQQAELGFSLSAPDAIKRGLNAQNGAGGLATTLKKGSEGPAVRYLQRRLSALGYQVSVDGKYGPGTEQAVRALQTAFGYDVDGIVGEATHKLVNQQIGYGFRADKPSA